MKKTKTQSRSCKIDFFYRPGRYWTGLELKTVHQELESIAKDCFRQTPRYQCLTGKRTEFNRNVITIARDKAGEAIGFCSAVILEVNGMKILHLGLTCVKKKARRTGLTHSLSCKLIMNYLLRTSKFKPIWVTNVACVLSSLGNVALHFENIYPSPYTQTPSVQHLSIARAIDRYHRSPIAINTTAVFDEENFVFRGSVDHTVFQKSEKDTRYFHRDIDLTQFYLKRLNFKTGDEVIQVGRVSLFSYPKYLVRMAALFLKKFTPPPFEHLKTNLFSRKP